MPTIRYSSADASAPVLTGDSAESLIGVLDACLVNGYGAKAAAGWTKPFSDGAGKAVFKNNGTAGTGCYVRFAKRAAENTFDGSTFATMSSIDVGTGQVGNSIFRSAMAADATAVEWDLVADDRTFYLRLIINDLNGSIVWDYTNLDGPLLLGGGDYERFGSHTNNYFFIGPNSETAHGVEFLGAFNTISRDSTYFLAVPHGSEAPHPDGISSPLGLRINRPKTNLEDRPNINGTCGIDAEPYSARGALIKIDPVIGSDADGYKFLGRLRGCWFPIQDLFSELPLINTSTNRLTDESQRPHSFDADTELWWLPFGDHDIDEAMTALIINLNDWS